MLKTTQVYLGLGANLGDALATFLSAEKQLESSLNTPITASNSFKSEPFTGLDQPTYYNKVLAFETALTAHELYKITTELEFSLGRKRTKERWSNRLIDIDIIAFGGEIIKDEQLTIPHYDLPRRDFFLVPLQEIAPNFTHPETQEAISDMIKKIPKELKTDLVIVS